MHAGHLEVGRHEQDVQCRSGFSLPGISTIKSINCYAPSAHHNPDCY